MQEVRSFNPFTGRQGNVLLQLLEKAGMYFYIDIENYKLHWISIHNHYIYTQASSKKYTGFEFTRGNLRVQWRAPCGGETWLPVQPGLAHGKSVSCGLTPRVQGRQKRWLVAPGSKVSFGEWAKRQMNHRNETKHGTEEKPKPQAMATWEPGVSPVIMSSKRDLNRTYGFTRTSIDQLNCSNKYWISTNRLTRLIR